MFLSMSLIVGALDNFPGLAGKVFMEARGQEGGLKGCVCACRRAPLLQTREKHFHAVLQRA